MRALFTRLIRFGAVGTGVALINYVLSVALIALGLHYLVAVALCWALGVCIGFAGNRRYTFGVKGEGRSRQFLAYVSTYIIQLALGLASFFVMIDVVGLPYTPAYVLNVVLMAAVAFSSMSLFVFAGRHTA